MPFVQGDIADEELAEQTLRDEEIEVVVNFAAESHNSLAVVDPGRFFRTNVIGTQTMLEAARRTGVGRFHHVSTCEVYGDLPLDSDEVFTEETPYRPRTPYNASKAGADHAVRAYFETYELPVTITNCSNNYGPFQFPEKVIPLFATNALDDKRMPLYASTANKREWLHVLDHCSAIELVLERGRPGETYNVGSGVEKSIEEIADAVLEHTGQAGVAEDDRPRPAGARPPLPARLVEAPRGARLARRDRLGGRASPRRSPGTRTTASGGSRSATARRSTKPPGARGGRGTRAGPRASAGDAGRPRARCAGPSTPAAAPGGRAPRS